MGIFDFVNKIIGTVQSVNNTAQNAKYTYDQAKNTVASMKSQSDKPEEVKLTQPEEVEDKSK